MERSALTASVIEELGALFTDALRAADPALAEANFDAVERQVQALGRVVFGRVVEQVLAERAALCALCAALAAGGQGPGVLRRRSPGSL